MEKKFCLPNDANEFAKLRSSRALAPYLPLRLCALRTFVPYVSSRLTCLIHVPYLRALRTFHALFVHLKIILGWICSPAEISIFHIFQELLKALQIVLFLFGSKTFHITIFTYIILSYYHISVVPL